MQLIKHWTVIQRPINKLLCQYIWNYFHLILARPFVSFFYLYVMLVLVANALFLNHFVGSHTYVYLLICVFVFFLPSFAVRRSSALS